MSRNVRYFLLMACFVFFLFPIHAHAQFGQCDPLNTNYIFKFDSGAYYPTLDTICHQPIVSIPVDCNSLGASFVDYSDVTMLSDGTFQAFSVGEDFGSSNGAVNITGTVTMPNGQVISYGGYGLHSYAQGHIQIPLDETNVGDVTINGRHELNWPKCDGFGQIYLTSVTFKLGVTIEWMGLTGLIAPSVYNYTPLDKSCAAKTVCGHSDDHQSNAQHTYYKEYLFWMSIGGDPPPNGTGEAFCTRTGPVIPIDTFYPGPYCYDVYAVR